MSEEKGAPEGVPSGDQRLLVGGWEITMRLYAGEDDREPDDDAKYLWFLTDRIITGDAWAAWEMPYSARAGSAIGEIDVMRADYNEPFLQRGIFQVEGDVLRLCLSPEGVMEPPSGFTSTIENDCLLYLAKRSSVSPPD